MIKLYDNYGKKIFQIISNYPLVLVLALSAAVATMLEIDKSNLAEYFYLTKITWTACLGIPLSLAYKFIRDRWKLHYSTEIMVLVLLIGFYFLLPHSEKDFSEVYVYLLIPIFLIAHLLVALSSEHPQQQESSFWQFNKNLFVNIFLTLVFTGVLIGGVQLAILAVDKLFSFNFNYQIYTKTFLFLLIFGSCFIFLLFCNDGLPTLEKQEEYPKILKFFTQFVLIPLLIIYLVILYFYTGKIIINWELPFGWVSYLVIAYSILGLLALLLVHPLKLETTKSWVKIFSRLFYFTLIPLIALLFVAIFTRIFQYGITEPRYFVLAIAVWLSIIVIYFIINKKDKIQFIPISLIIACIFSISIPYFNAFSVSKRSQKSEFINLLNSEKLLKGKTIDFNKKVTNKIADDVSSKIAFFMLRDEGNFVKEYLKTEDYKTITQNTELRWKFTYESNTRNLFTQIVNNENAISLNLKEINSDGSFVDISGYQYLANAWNINNKVQKIGNDSFILEDKFGNNHNRILNLKLSTGEQLDFVPLIKEKFNQNKAASTTLPEVSVEGNIGKYHVKLVFENISITHSNFLAWGDYKILIKQIK